MNLKFNKEQLEAALEARRGWARRLDAKRKAQHVREESKYLERFRAHIREALKWDYEHTKKRSFSVGLNGYSERDRRPNCPEGVELNLDKAISQVAMDGRTRYVLSALPPKRHGYEDTSYIYWLLTHDENAKKDVCEV